MMPTLLIDLGGGEIRELSIGSQRITIGRRAGCEVRLPHASVSAQHAAIVAERGGWLIEDLASRNGTLVNGKRVVRHRLGDRDLIEVGVHRIVFTEAADEPAVADAEVTVSPRQGEAIVTPAEEAQATETSVAGDAPAGSAPIPQVLPAIPPRSLVRLTGADEGSETRLTRGMMAIGREGAVAAWVIHREGEFLVVAPGGEMPVTVDGKAVGSGPVKLRPGRRLSVAGTDFYFKEDRAPEGEAGPGG